MSLPSTAALPSARQRLASLLYEGLLLLGVLAPTFILPHLAIGLAFEVTAPGWLLWLHIFVVLGAYFLWYWRSDPGHADMENRAHRPRWSTIGA